MLSRERFQSPSSFMSHQCSCFVPSILHWYCCVCGVISKEGHVAALYCQWEWWFRDDLSTALEIELERVTCKPIGYYPNLSV